MVMMIMIVITITTITITTANVKHNAEILNCTNQQQEPTALCAVSLASPTPSFKSVPSRNIHGRPHFLTIGYCQHINLGFFLSTHSLRTLYNSLILPYLYYCNLAWGGTYKTNLQRIVILQERAVRKVNNSTYDANNGPIFKKLELLRFHDIRLFQLAFLMFSFKISTLPSQFNNLFFMNSQIHNYNTRNAHSFRLSLCRTNTRLFSIYFQDPKFYNSLNSVITGSSSSASFKA